MKRLGIALLLLLASVVRAQELEVFDASDFIDPRDRGAVFDPNALFGVLEPGDAFTRVRAYTGRVLNDYQWRSDDRQAEANFLHLTTTLYRADHQFNAKLTLLRDDGDASLTSYRGTLQYGRYFVTANSVTREREEGEKGEKEDIRVAGRYVVTLAAEHNEYAPRGGATTTPRKMQYDYGVESTGYVRYGRNRLTGSLVWTHRSIDADRSIDRISYYYRIGDRTYRDGRFRWNANMGWGVERNDGWHFGVTRLVLTGAVELPALRTGLNVAYAPTYVPGRSGRSTYHEVAVFLDTTVLARIGSILR